MALIDVPGIHGIIRLFATELLQRTEDERILRAQRADRSNKPNRPNQPKNREKRAQDDEKEAVYRAYKAIEHRIPPWVRSMIQYASNAAMIRFRLKQLELKELDASEEYGSEIDACLCSKGFRPNDKRKQPLTLGAGAYGKVYEVDRTSCPGLASAVEERSNDAGSRSKSKRNSPSRGAPEKEAEIPVAVKVQVIQTQKVLDSWHKELRITKRAGELGVGPRVYDGFLCHRANGKSFGFIIMELVRGVTLLDLIGDRIIDGELSSDERLLFEDIKQRFEQQRKILHKNGIYHGDLHIGNLMVVPKENRNAGDKATGKGGETRAKVPPHSERILRPKDIKQVRIFDFGAAEQVIGDREDDEDPPKIIKRKGNKKREAGRLAIIGVGAHGIPDNFEWETYENPGIDVHALEHGMRLMTLFLVDKEYIKL